MVDRLVGLQKALRCRSQCRLQAETPRSETAKSRVKLILETTLRVRTHNSGSSLAVGGIGKPRGVVSCQNELALLTGVATPVETRHGVSDRKVARWLIEARPLSSSLQTHLHPAMSTKQTIGQWRGKIENPPTTRTATSGLGVVAGRASNLIFALSGSRWAAGDGNKAGRILFGGPLSYHQHGKC